MDGTNILRFFRIQTQSRAATEDCELDESSNLCSLLNLNPINQFETLFFQTYIDFLLKKCAVSGRAAKDDPSCRWPNGIVPYEFYQGPIQEMVYNPNEVHLILKVQESLTGHEHVYHHCVRSIEAVALMFTFTTL